MIFIRIGYPATTGKLEGRVICRSRSAAILELRDKGFTRDVARDIIRKVTAIDFGNCMVLNRTCQWIEVMNFGTNSNHFLLGKS